MRRSRLLFAFLRSYHNCCLSNRPSKHVRTPTSLRVPTLARLPYILLSIHSKTIRQEYCTQPLPDITLGAHIMGDTKSISTTSSGSKRKKTAPGFYAVTVGHRPGIYQNWEDVQRQVKGYPGGYQRKFDTEEDAGHFLRTGQLPDKPQTKYYAVRGGPNPGVYKSWDEAKQHVHGHTGVKHKSFPYEEEAWAFLHTVDGQSTAASVVPSTAPSIKGEYGSETPLTDIRKGCKISDSPAKKQKMNGGYATTTLTNDEFEAGTGPLPHNAEDGFDRRLKLNPVSGILQYKTGRELAARKLQPNGDFSGTLVIYTDGSALGNGTAGAVGGLGVWFGPNDPRNVSEPLHGEKQSNQRAELMACKRAMDIAPIDRTVEIRTDSNYSIQCLTKWFVGWEKGNKWLNSAGKPVENRDIIEPTIARIREREQAGAKTIFVHVYGHTGHDGNEAADALAKNGARRALVIRRTAAPVPREPDYIDYDALDEYPYDSDGR